MATGLVNSFGMAMEATNRALKTVANSDLFKKGATRYSTQESLREMMYGLHMNWDMGEYAHVG